MSNPWVPNTEAYTLSVRGYRNVTEHEMFYLIRSLALSLSRIDKGNIISIMYARESHKWATSATQPFRDRHTNTRMH